MGNELAEETKQSRAECAFDGLLRAVSDLESLARKIAPPEPTAGEDAPKEPQRSLCEFLSCLPNDIDYIMRRIDSAVQSIRESVF